MKSTDLVQTFFGPSLFSKKRKAAGRVPALKTYVDIPAPLIQKMGERFFDITVIDGFAPTQVKNAFLTAEGLIFQGLKISPFSNFYGMLTPTKLIKAWFKCLTRPAHGSPVESAYFVSQQVVYKGSFGDYCLEYLSTLCCNLPPQGSCLALAQNFSKKYLLEDIQELRLKPLELPPNGLRIKNLTVLPPGHFFDNLTPPVVKKIQEAFPTRGHLSTLEDKNKLYLSRVNFSRDGAIRSSQTGRGILNEFEVETFLSERGFDIIRPHEMDNHTLRLRLSNAGIVVAAHGAAMFHMIWNPPQQIIELAHMDWYLPSFLKMACSLGVPDYRLISTVDGKISLTELGRHLDNASPIDLTSNADAKNN